MYKNTTRGTMPPRKKSYGNSDRLDPDAARQLIRDLVFYMKHRTWDMEENGEIEVDRSEDEPSPQKKVYGDVWTFLYGIDTGVYLMQKDRDIEYDWEQSEKIDRGVSGDDSWQEHYDTYGYGAYGRGLEIGKRLAFYEDRDFTFSNSGQPDESDSTFEIRSYE